MNNKDVLINAFSLAGYRSFGKQPQQFDQFSKINIFIGQNNCGKSNLLRFIHDIYPNLSKRQNLSLEPLDRHILTNSEFIAGLPVSLEKNSDNDYEDFNNQYLEKFSVNSRNNQLPGYVLQAFQEKARLDNTENVWFEFNQQLQLKESNWINAFGILDDQPLQRVWNSLTGSTNGNRKQHWYPQTIAKLTPQFTLINRTPMLIVC